ncbi:mismatch repair protein MSH3 [Trametes versicolor FP-101664 SS1]|uniref:mismatch repair protein MSH3 n=1 Tax=Trametes versicolor (strain FP-101664) TaxID=717944 RepID=UPI0004621F6A|nr:mismatch repair protein MSH3 [Trametes versicolor FP-101664 SS1]EIW60757.1 hypothetical protein TRAVEDRAFT_57899 [Trametes versicolor FP-101664 SS1]
MSAPHGTQATISSFFSKSQSSGKAGSKNKRGNSPIDLTLDSENEELAPVRKRQRTTTSTFFSPRRPGASASKSGAAATKSGGHAEQWRFNPSSPSKSQKVIEDATQRDAHERAKRILLGSADVFNNTNRSADAAPSSDVEEEAEILAAPAEDDVDDAEQKFGELMEMFSSSSSKGKRKGKGTAKKTGPPVAGPSRSKSQKTEEIGPSGQPYTPFELQVRELKAKYPGTVLMIQSGYKMLFFDEDAKIASKELGMVCFPKRNFLTAMIPLHRRDVHMKKLLSHGYKVGIVEQTETAALKKAGETRNELFGREVTHMYTAATFVDDLNSVDELDPNSAPPLMCFLEEPKGGMGTDERVTIAMIAISPSTGDVVWDEFEDNHMRTELETRMVHTKPYELLLPSKKLSPATEKMIKHFTEHSHTEHRMRIERFSKQMAYTDAFAILSKFYTDKTHANASEGFNNGDLMAAITEFSKIVVITLAQSLNYLATFNVADALRETRFFSKFTERTHMLLNANTLTNLEIYVNDTDYTTKGSLMWILDRTSTKFGARLLRSWVGKPLVDAAALRERTDAVEEILSNRSPRLTQLRELLRRLPDLARGLCRIQYGKCTPQELAVLLKAFRRVSTTFTPPHPAQSQQAAPAAGLHAGLLVGIVESLPRLRDPVKEICDAVDFAAAEQGKEEAMWTDIDRFPELDSLTACIQVAESELMDELKTIRKVLKKPALKYTEWNGEEYVVEIRKDERRDIPVNWTLLSSTKFARRYHTPEVRAKLQERAQYKEGLAIEARKAFLTFLAEITDKYYALLRDAVNKLAVADCLFSLAQVAAQEGYARPEFVDRKEGEGSENDVLEIVEGRHPMIEALRTDPFVPNSVRMGGSETRHRIITGPNMGGKSSAVRMTALCAVMAQIGSYVPAKSMKLSLLDGILTRMGASDELARGRSTFMVEMQETSDILQMATSKTLVVLDELGRGTSTFDGMAIAGAVLQHLVQEVKCKTLFITHYPQVATDLERMFPSDVGNMHMGFTEETRVDGTREVTFLYRLEPGLVTESFGVECARLAGLPETVLQVATTKAANMKIVIEERIKRTK